MSTYLFLHFYGSYKNKLELYIVLEYYNTSKFIIYVLEISIRAEYLFTLESPESRIVLSIFVE